MKKDIDYLNWKLKEESEESKSSFESLNPKKLASIFRMLDRDVKYLSSMNLMDYSMLVGI